MTDNLRFCIGALRTALHNAPNGILAGEIHSPIQNASTGNTQWDQFLGVADGGRFGAIEIWATHELAENQYYASDFPGGPTNWLVVGLILYEPLALSLESSEVFLFPINGESKSLGAVDEFLADYMFGARYAEIVPEAGKEEWWWLLQEQGLI